VHSWKLKFAEVLQNVGSVNATEASLVRLFTPPPPPPKKRCLVEGVVAVSDSDSEANDCIQMAEGTNIKAATTEAAAASADANYCACVSEAFFELGNAVNPCDEQADKVIISDDDNGLELLTQEREEENVLQRSMPCMPVESIAQHWQHEELFTPQSSTVDDQPNSCVELAGDFFAEFAFHAPTTAFKNADATQFVDTLPKKGRPRNQPAAAAVAAASSTAAAAAAVVGKPKQLLAKVGTADQSVMMPAEDRLRVLEKWQDLAGRAPHPEALRFQLIVAAILHPKASEAAVRRCMLRLHDWASKGTGNTPDTQGSSGLTPARLAAAAEEDIERILEGLHWHRTKASRIVSAAKVVEAARQAGQGVPRIRKQLLNLPGVGPKLAQLLEFVCGELAVDETEHCDVEQPHRAVGGASQVA